MERDYHHDKLRAHLAPDATGYVSAANAYQPPVGTAPGAPLEPRLSAIGGQLSDALAHLRSARSRFVGGPVDCPMQPAAQPCRSPIDALLCEIERLAVELGSEAAILNNAI